MDMMKQAKKTIALGGVSMVGHGVLGAMSGMNGMPQQAQTTANIAHSGLNLLNVGNLANVGMGMAKSIGNVPKKGKTGNKYIDRIM